MKEKAPAYQRYPKQIMGDDKVLLMDWDAYGMHNWLLDISWQQDSRGTIPDDTTVLRRWLRNPDEETWRRVWPQLKTVWPILESGRRGNSGMIRCAEKQENYSKGNSTPKGAAKRTQTDTQIERKNIEEEVVVPVLEVAFEKKFVLPIWIPEEAWSAYVLMRLKSRKPMTDRARELVIKKLEKFLGEGQDIEQVLNNSVIGNWTDVYPVKEQRNGREQSKSEKRDERNRENLSAGLRAFHGDSAVDVLGFTGTKHRDPVIGTDAVVVGRPKVLPPRSD